MPMETYVFGDYAYLVGVGAASGAILRGVILRQCGHQDSEELGVLGDDEHSESNSRPRILNDTGPKSASRTSRMIYPKPVFGSSCSGVRKH